MTRLLDLSEMIARVRARDRPRCARIDANPELANAIVQIFSEPAVHVSPLKHEHPPTQPAIGLDIYIYKTLNSGTATTLGRVSLPTLPDEMKNHLFLSSHVARANPVRRSKTSGRGAVEIPSTTNFQAHKLIARSINERFSKNNRPPTFFFAHVVLIEKLPEIYFAAANPDTAPKVADRAIRAYSRDFQSQTRQPRGLVGFLDAEAKMPRCIEDESYLALASARGRP